MDYYNQFIRDIRRFGVTDLQVIPSENTGGFKLVYFDNGDRTLQTLGIAGNLPFERLSRSTIHALRSAKYILLGPILNEIDKEFVTELRKVSKAKLFLDPQGLIRKVGKDGMVEKVFDKGLVKEIIELADFVKPNEFEAEIISGVSDPVESVKIFEEWCGGSVAVVTLGERGSILAYREEVHKIPAFNTFAKDPTGAGDSYAGSFITRLLEGADLLEAAYYASAASSIMVEYTGPDFNMTPSEVIRRMNLIKAPKASSY